MRKLTSAAVVIVLAIGMTMSLAAQNPVTQAGNEAQNAASSAGKAVKKGAETGYDKTKEGATKAYDTSKEAVTGQSQDKPDQAQSTTESGNAQQAPTKGSTLPQTASPLPLLGLLGVAMVAMGARKTRP